jgi:ribosome maturation factor RimP
MKKTKRQIAAKYLPLTPEQTAAITVAWQQLLDAHLPAEFVWLDAVFEKEAGAWYLRAYVETTAKTISLDQCAMLTRLLDDKLDALPIPADCAYHLEVSSPGLFRQLRTPKELAFYQGEPVRAVREGHAPVEGMLGPLTTTQASPVISLVPASQPGEATIPVQLPWTPDLTITLNYSLTNLEDAADD